MAYIRPETIELWRSNVPRFEEDLDKCYDIWLTVNSRLLQALDRIEELERTLDKVLKATEVKLYHPHNPID